MNYRELLNRYKQGIANEEEKKIVEQEIEKYEALEDYLSETLDQEFTDITRISSAEMDGEETIQLKKSVNNKLRKVVFTSVLAVVVLYISVFYGISGIIDRVYYDPTAVSQSKEQAYQWSDFYYDMRAYISLNMPGYSIYSLTFQAPKGFGNYEVSYSLRDLFTNDDQRHFVNLSRGKLTYAMDGIFSTKNRFWIWEGFEKIQYHSTEDAAKGATEASDKEVQRKNEETLRHLNELNPLSYISMSIVFDRDLTMEEFYHMSKKYPSLDFKWIGIRTVEAGTQWSETQPMHLIGFNPNYNDEPSSNLRPDPQKYPFFDLNLAEFTGNSVLTKKEFPEALPEAYGIHFRSRLEYLRNREEFVDIFDYNHYKTDFYDDALVYIDEHGVETYGVLVFGTAEEFLESISEIPYDSLYINKVLPTKPNIYYR
jgi:hypothetical protein